MTLTELYYHKDPRIFREGEMAPRAYFIPFGVEGGALAERGESDRLTMLSGEWLFKYSPSLYGLEDFTGVGYIPEGFSTVAVPEMWQCRGLDYAQYESAAYPFVFNPPYVPEKNPAAAYIKKFNIRKRAGRRYELHIEGKDSCVYAFLNGSLLGYGEAPHSTSLFDVTEALTDGENTLSLLILKWCSGSYLDDQDKIRLSGLFREVYILERDAEGIRDFRLTAEMDGRLTLSVESDTPTTARVYDGVRCIFEAALEEGEVSTVISSPHLWSAEDPYLYDLYLTSGEEVIRHRFGFRTAEVKEGVFRVNGEAVKIYGVNRHDSHPDTGYAMTKEQVREELLMMKRFNINAIRTSHYPNSPFFYELCDELGFYVMCEADYESDGCGFVKQSYRVSDSPEYVDAIVDRNVRMAEAYKNFTCITMWSLGNESTWGQGLVAAAKALRRIDSTRPVHYEQFFLNHNEKSEGEKREIWNYLDFYSNMYPTLTEQARIADMEWVRGSIIMCEYSHAMGNSSGDMRFYDEIIQSSDRYAGGYVWEWADHAIRLRDERGEYLGYGGDFGEHHHRGNVCMDGAVTPDRVPHSGLYEIAAVYAPVRVERRGEELIFTNRNFFTNLDSYMIDYAIDLDGATVECGNLDVSAAPKTSAAIRLVTEDCYAGECATLTVTVRLGEATAYADAGHIIYAKSFPLKTTGAPERPKAAAPEVITDNCFYTVRGEGFEYVFRRDTAELVSLTASGEEILTEPLSPVCMRAITDNDNSQISIEQNMGHKWRGRFSGDITYPETVVRNLTLRRGEDCVSLSCDFILGVQGRVPVSLGVLEYRIYGDGRLTVSEKGKIHEALPYFLPRYGFRLSLPAMTSDIEYYGWGPHECYEDKISLATRGKFAYTPDDPVGAYETPQESGSHCYTDWLTFRIGRARIKVTSHGCGKDGRGFSFSASRYSIPDTMSARHRRDLTPSDSLYLYLDYRMSGVGSASCGGEFPLESVRINPGEELDFSFIIDVVK